MKQGGCLNIFFLFLMLLSGSTVWGDVSDTPKNISSETLSTAVGTEICRVLENKNRSYDIGSWIETTESADELVRFYNNAQCQPVWSNDKGIDPKALYMIHAIRHAAAYGLDIYDPAYNLETIFALMGMIKSDKTPKNRPAVLARLDIMLTDAYFMLARHLYYGVLPRDRASERWSIAEKRPISFSLLLQQALLNNELIESLERLSPASVEYQGLKNMLEKYLLIEAAGGWKKIEFAKGEEKYFTEEIKERLRSESYLAADEDSDQEYRDALISFQQSHGIKADGIVGKETLSKLNVSVQEKIMAIRLNMERWRWMPTEMEHSYISVNIPDFTLNVVNDDVSVMKMKAIVGKIERPTQLFDAWMKYIVVNPYWRVPDTILREDIIPKMAKDTRYLKKERIRIFKYADQSAIREINAASIDWKNADADTFPYYLRQDAGRKNVLGRLKFMLPNPYDIYIHDTPDKYLFEETTRAFSSGCIRIEDPLALAEYLMENDGKEINISGLIGGSANKNIFLSKPVKVYVNYWTAWEDENGKANFREDIYGYDSELAEDVGWSYDHW